MQRNFIGGVGARVPSLRDAEGRRWDFTPVHGSVPQSAAAGAAAATSLQINGLSSNRPALSARSVLFGNRLVPRRQLSRNVAIEGIRRREEAKGTVNRY